MSFRLWYNLLKIKRTARPTKQFRLALGYKLSERFEAIYGLEKKETAFKIRGLKYAAAVLSLVLVLAGSAGAYAYSSPEVGEEHPLYPLKTGLEKIENQLARAPEKNAAFNLKLMARRQAEMEKLQKKNRDFEKTLAAFNRAQEAGLTAAENVTASEVRGILLQRIAENGLTHLERLEEVRKNLPPVAQPRIELIIQRQTGRLEERLEKMRENQARVLEKQAEIFGKMREQMEKQMEKFDLMREELEIIRQPLIKSFSPGLEKPPGRAERKNKK